MAGGGRGVYCMEPKDHGGDFGFCSKQDENSQQDVEQKVT